MFSLIPEHMFECVYQLATLGVAMVAFVMSLVVVPRR